jgi:hypothetical protein
MNNKKDEIEVKKTKIYLITNCYNNPNFVYVGKTINKDNNRKNHHKRKFGNKIIFTYIDEINSLDRKYWKPLESYWIEQFRQWGFRLMNKNTGGGGASYHSVKTRHNMLKKSNEHKDKILKLYKNKSILKISSIINLDYGTIKSLLIREGKYEKNKNHKQSSSQKEKMKQIMINKLGIPILQQDKKGNIIKEYPSQAEAFRQTGTRQSDISACCAGKQKTAGGYIWKFKN